MKRVLPVETTCRRARALGCLSANGKLLERTEGLIGVRTFPDFTDVIFFKLS